MEEPKQYFILSSSTSDNKPQKVYPVLFLVRESLIMTLWLDRIPDKKKSPLLQLVAIICFQNYIAEKTIKSIVTCKRQMPLFWQHRQYKLHTNVRLCWVIKSVQMFSWLLVMNMSYNEAAMKWGWFLHLSVGSHHLCHCDSSPGHHHTHLRACLRKQ